MEDYYRFFLKGYLRLINIELITEYKYDVVIPMKGHYY